MENKVELTTENFTNDAKLKHAIIANIEFENGTKTKAVMIFNNNDLNFEEMKIGLNEALFRIERGYKKTVKNIESSFGSIVSGVYEKDMDFIHKNN